MGEKTRKTNTDEAEGGHMSLGHLGARGRTEELWDGCVLLENSHVYVKKPCPNLIFAVSCSLGTHVLTSV